MRCDAYIGLKSGGSVGHLSGVLNSMANSGHKVELFSSDYLENVDYKRVRLHEWPGSFPGWNIPVGGGSVFTDRAVTSIVFRHFSERPSPDSILYHRFHLGTLGALLVRKKLGVPLILEFNGSEIWIEANWGRGAGVMDRYFLALENEALRQADAVVVVSQILKDQLISRGLAADKIICVPNGVDPDVFDPARFEAKRKHIRAELGWDEKIVIGFVGTFGRWHGTDVLAQAIEKVANNPDTRLRFLVIGDGPLKPQFEAALTDSGRAITFLAGRLPQDRTPSYLSSCDAYVSPHVPNHDGTPFFGSPTKLFEYMAMAKPVFASNLEQIGEIIENGKSGVLLPPGDLGALVDALVSFERDPENFRILGACARERILKKYTWQAHWNTIEHEFRGLISRQLKSRIPIPSTTKPGSIAEKRI